jgi:hypothetical protein
MSRSTKGVECLRALMLGGGIALCAAAIFLSLSGSTLMDSDWPDSPKTAFWMKLADEGLITWLCAGGSLFGIGVAVAGCVRPFFQKPAGREGRPEDA